jgi:hypothetical protein
MTRDVADQRPDAFDDLFSDAMFMSDADANRMTEWLLAAGAEILRADFIRGGNTAVEAVLCWLSRRRVCSTAARIWDGQPLGRICAMPGEPAFRYRWRTQAAYYHDLVLWMLTPRMTPQAIGRSNSVIDEIHAGRVPPADGIAEIVIEEARLLSADESFQLQLMFAATLRGDDRIGEALRRVEGATVEAWRMFWATAIEAGAFSLREGLGTDEFASILCMAIDRIARRRVGDPRRAADGAAVEWAGDGEPWLAPLIGALIGL